MNPFLRIATEIAAREGISPAYLNGRRVRIYKHLRDEALWRVYASPRVSMVRLARWARRDHSTVRSGILKHQERYEAEHAERWS